MLLWCSTQKVGSPLAKIGRRLGVPTSWLHYSESVNAVVERAIENCRDYLKMHFSDGDEGEIWLYNSDLNAFLSETEFTELYLNTVAENERITSVKIVLKRDVLKGVESSMNVWRIIDDNLRITRPGGCPPALRKLWPKLVYCFTDAFPEKQKLILEDTSFKAYTAAEGFVFYTRGLQLTHREAVCVHRRLSGDGSSGRQDLRITVTASRAGPVIDGFHKFMPEDWRQKFECLFEPGDHWEPFSDLVKKKLAAGSDG